MFLQGGSGKPSPITSMRVRMGTGYIGDFLRGYSFVFLPGIRHLLRHGFPRVRAMRYCMISGPCITCWRAAFVACEDGESAGRVLRSSYRYAGPDHAESVIWGIPGRRRIRAFLDTPRVCPAGARRSPARLLETSCLSSLYGPAHSLAHELPIRSCYVKPLRHSIEKT